MMSLHRIALCGALFTNVSFAAQANPIIINPGFEQTTTSGSTSYGGICYPGAPVLTCMDLVDWTNTDGYSFVSATTNLGVSAFNAGYSVTLWELPAVSQAAQLAGVGGNFLAVDGGTWGAPRGTISQTISNLIVGSDYAVTFWQAAGQQRGTSSGATTEQWEVGFGSATQYSALMNNASESAVAWNQQTLIFRVTNPSEALTFTAIGTPNGSPPFVLLDALSVSYVPEPSTLTAFGIGVAALAAARRRRALARA